MNLNYKIINFHNSFSNNYFLLLFAMIPASILFGPAISLSNILIIIISFLFIFFRINRHFLFKDNTILMLVVLYLYLILNSLISIDFEISAQRNFGFLRYILLFIAINYFFQKKENLYNLNKIWLAIISLVLIDIAYEFNTGHNILGFEADNKKRIVSFFKDEAIVGAFVNGFIFILIGFLFVNYEKKNNLQKFLIYSFIIFVISCMIFTGERSNTIKLFVGLFLFFWLNNKINFKYKLFFAISGLCIFLFSFYQFTEIKHRYYNDIILKFSDQDKRINYIYFKLYKSGIEVFKTKPYLGVGNKNYRVVTCGTPNKELICNSHPHQIYLEFLSEHGVIGTLILLGIIFYLLFKNLKIILLSRNLLQIGCFCYLLTVFLPLLPGGSFFSDFNATMFWINFSLFYASNLNTNIFTKT